MFNFTDIVCENIFTYRYSIGAWASVCKDIVDFPTIRHGKMYETSGFDIFEWSEKIDLRQNYFRNGKKFKLAFVYFHVESRISYAVYPKWHCLRLTRCSNELVHETESLTCAINIVPFFSHIFCYFFLRYISLRTYTVFNDPV